MNIEPPSVSPHNHRTVYSEGLSHKGDQVHFDSRSYRELGHRYARAYQELTIEK